MILLTTPSLTAMPPAPGPAAVRPDPPFRAEHVGSLLRPPALLQARAAHASGEIGVGRLRAFEDHAISDAVAMQERIGLRAATDGEFRRTSSHLDFLHRLGGIEATEDRAEVPGQGCTGEEPSTSERVAVRSRVRLDEPIFADDLVALQQTVTTAVPKLTIPSPSTVHQRTAVVDRSVYPDLDELRADLAEAYADEVRAMGELGCRYLQLDDTSLACLDDPAQRAALAAHGVDADTVHLRYIDQINAALAGRSQDVRVTVHLCRGDHRASWAAEGGYDVVAEALFGSLGVDGFSCEFDLGGIDDAQCGGFEPLRFVPPGKQVVLGLVATGCGELEDADLLKRRIDEAAKYVPLEQLCLSPQCGFSSTVGCSTPQGRRLTHDEQVAKLELVVRVAEDVWG